MTRKSGTASGPVRRGGGAGQRVKQFAVERGIRVPAPLAQIIAPDAPAASYTVETAVANEPAGSRPAPAREPRRSAKKRPSKQSPSKTRPVPVKAAAARKPSAKSRGRNASRKPR